MRSPPAKRPDRTRTVFINCPFDADYRPLLRAVCFAIKACGYESRCALDTSDSGVLRFLKIVEMITACDRSIHDISRVELDRTSHLPRFNMPLELGADLGLRLAGPKLQQRRKTLVLDTEAHRYDKTLSDISGMDIEAHGNRVPDIIRVVRDWLNANRHPGTPPFPGAAAINADHGAYQILAPDIVASLRLDPHNELPHGDYLHVVDTALQMIETACSDTTSRTSKH